MDELKPSPRIDWMYELAQKLREAPEKLAKANPILGTLANAGREYLTEPAARGLESWAYGDRFFGPPANAPMLNQRSLDMLAAAPVGALSPASKGVAGAALYAGTKRPELMMTHSTKAGTLLRENQLPKELYHTSFGIKNNDVMTEFGPVTLVPRPEKLDPRSAPSTLHAFDAYTPRFQHAAGSRIDDLVDPENIPADIDYAKYLREGANARLADRLVSGFRKGGMAAEGLVKKSRAVGLPQYGGGGYRIGNDRLIWEQGNPANLGTQRMSYGHRFPSYENFEKDPRGANRLTIGDPHELVYKDISDWLRVHPDFAYKHGVEADLLDPTTISENKQVPRLLQAAASARPGIPEEHVKQAREFIKALRGTRTEYAELKNWGPLQLNPENFAGMMVNTGVNAGTRAIDPYQILRLEKEAKRRGLPFHAMDYNEDPLGIKPADIVYDMQALK